MAGRRVVSGSDRSDGKRSGGSRRRTDDGGSARTPRRAVSGQAGDDGQDAQSHTRSSTSGGSRSGRRERTGTGAAGARSAGAASGKTKSPASSRGTRSSRDTQRNAAKKTSREVTKRAAGSGRVASSGRSAQSTPHRSDEVLDLTNRQSNPGEFVDPLSLDGEDIVAKTLEETSGTLGVATRPKVVDFNARLKERRRANARSIALRVAAVVAAVAVLAGLVWLLFFSSVFRLEVSQISVSGGNEWVSESEVLDIASEQAGKSLLLVSSDDVVDQLNDIPGVTQAEVVKEFPNGLSVTVEAQKPAAMLQTPDGTLTAVDTEGRALNSVDDASNDGIPVIEVDSVDDGQSDRAVLEALQILSELSDDMRARISSVSAQTQDSITTQLDDGAYTVVWGDSSDLDLKIAVVEEILGDPDVIGDKTQVDVSAPLRPIIK